MNTALPLIATGARGERVAPQTIMLFVLLETLRSTLWMVGIPIPIILLLWLVTGHA
jgi:hypothetical protein